MNARDRILERLWWAVPSVNDGQAKRLAERMLDDFAHELAEEIRASRLEAPEGFTFRHEWVDAWNAGRDDSADLIDPEVQK